MAVLFVLSGRPVSPTISKVPDWVGHGSLYAVLAVLTCRALAPAGRLTAGRGALAVALATAYGVTDEWHQSFVPFRTAEAADVVKDFAGAALGAFLFHLRGPAAEGPPAQELHP
ncbi:MAG TPA: VanZ family protein [Vicinamibacteria bacterium]|nr:VanZ family protein [Vicinamibacteria bacterium]